jgi:predicted nuclease of restriction endonuclease-like (RecB) superfamily
LLSVLGRLKSLGIVTSTANATYDVTSAGRAAHMYIGTAYSGALRGRRHCTDSRSVRFLYFTGIIMKTSRTESLTPSVLANDVRVMIEEVREHVARAISSGTALLYWRIGRRILIEILDGTRADYGKAILATLSQQLQQDYGAGYSYSALTRMVRFAEIYQDAGRIAFLSETLGWSHFRELISIQNDLQREFYAEMCRIERWSVRTLRANISGMLYERTMVSKQSEHHIRTELENIRTTDRVTPLMVFRDPYVLQFLGLDDQHVEKDLEDAILRDIESFLIELGDGFAFLGRQKRITVDNDDFYLDLLFYHRRLRRLIALELKLGVFRPEYKGQMELYLRWLARYEQHPDEETPLGIILCAGKKQEQIELLELGESGIHVAEYVTELPSREVLMAKLNASIHASRTRLDGQR